MSDFDDIVSNYNVVSDLYTAVLRTEQDYPGLLPHAIGMLAWGMLSEDQRDACIPTALQGYVETLLAQRKEGTQQSLHDAMDDYNGGQRTEFRVRTTSMWLQMNGPTYQVGDVRAKALFEDDRGRHWVDGALVAESLCGVANGPISMEGYAQALCGPDTESHDLWVCTDTRGRWNALMAPVEVVAATFGYPTPWRLPDGEWARTWWDMPERSDHQELAWIADGGRPLNSYRGGQL